VGKIRLRTWRRLVLVLFAAIFAAIIYRWISLERLQRFVPIEISGTPTPEPTATRPPVITGKLDTAKLFNGITFHSTVETTPGARTFTEQNNRRTGESQSPTANAFARVDLDAIN